MILEPVQNSGGCFVPPEGYLKRVREICDEFGVLLISDEVICSWGRLGDWFGASARLPARPHHHGEGHHFRVRADGRGDRLRPRLRAVRRRPGAFAHGLTFGGHPVSAAVALANIDLLEEEGLNDRARNQGAFRAMLDSLLDIPIVGDVRGMGYFMAIELVNDRETKATLRRRSATGCSRLPLPETCSGAG